MAHSGCIDRLQRGGASDERGPGHTRDAAPSRHRYAVRQPRHVRDGAGARARRRRHGAWRAGAVRGRGDRRGRRLRAHGGPTGRHAPASRARARQWRGQPAQRAPRPLADRQRGGRARARTHRPRRAADHRHRGRGAAVLEVGADRRRAGGCRRRHGRGDRGGAHPGRSGHADRAGGRAPGPKAQRRPRPHRPSRRRSRPANRSSWPPASSAATASAACCCSVAARSASRASRPRHGSPGRPGCGWACETFNARVARGAGRPSFPRCRTSANRRRSSCGTSTCCS